LDPNVTYGNLREASSIREWEEGVAPASKSTLTASLGGALKQYREICQTDLFRSAAQCFQFIWVMNEKCELLISYEEIVTGDWSQSEKGNGLKNGHPRRRGFPSHPADEKKLGHPTLLGGGKARMAGELFLDVDNGKLQWYVSCGSGRYCRETPPTSDQQHNVHSLFMSLIDDQVRFDAI
jgi:hypothetical protein